jgi:hypothetical protein
MSLLSRLFPASRAAVAALPYPAGSSEGLAARWVRWIASFAVGDDPISDPTGEHAGREQPDDVWFLAGTFGAPARRRFTVPADRPLFGPVVNIWQRAPHEILRPESATAYARLDGTPVDPIEVATPQPFEVVGVRGNAATGRSSPRLLTVWGHGLQLPGLSAGSHHLAFRGAVDGDFTVDVDLTLDVR